MMISISGLLQMFRLVLMDQLKHFQGYIFNIAKNRINRIDLASAYKTTIPDLEEFQQLDQFTKRSLDQKMK
jgi:hypothetical protein